MQTGKLLPWLLTHKEEMLSSLKYGKYRPNSARRVEIPKDGGKKRPLGIPTVVDRLVQQSISQVLSPIYEREFSAHSYGFRPGRSCHDALHCAQPHVNGGYKHVVDLDLEKFFDTVSHSRLIEILSKRIKDGRVISLIHKYLLSGIMIGSLFEESPTGVPQGGIISPTLANATLDGMKRMLKEKHKAGYVNGKLYCPKVNLVRYADDFIVTADKKETLLEIKGMLTAFLKERGLTLSEEKTLIAHISNGFDFLGFNLRKYNGTLIIKSSKKSQKRFTEKMHEVVLTKGKALSQQELIERLNPIIRGWGNYYSHVASKEVFCRCDHILVNQLKRWSYCRHTNKSREWIRKKYFIRKDCRIWIFGYEYAGGGIKEKFTLNQLTEIPIKRHIKIKCETNPFDPSWDEYFERRKPQSARQRA